MFIILDLGAVSSQHTLYVSLVLLSLTVLLLCKTDSEILTNIPLHVFALQEWFLIS